MPITNASSKAAAIGLAVLIAPAASITAYAAADRAAPAAAASAIAPPSILVFDQKPDNTSVTIKYVHLPRSGYVAIYNTDANGKATGEPLGHVALKAGDHRDLKVQLSKAPPAAARLQASLYDDKDGDSKLDRSKDISFWADAKLPSGGMFQIQ